MIGTAGLHMLRVFLLFVFALPVAAEPGPPPYELKLDTYGDPIPRGAKLRLGTVRWRFDDLMHSLAFSENDQSIRSCIDLNFVEWDRATGRIQRSLTLGMKARGLKLSADGRILCGIDEKGHIRRWEAASGQELPVFGVANTEYSRPMISPDGSLIAAALFGDKTVEIDIWDTRKQSKLQRLTVPNEDNFGMIISGDGKHFACKNEGMIHLFDLVSGKIIHQFKTQSVAFREIAFSPTGLLFVACNSNGELQFWDVKTGKACLKCQSDDHFGGLVIFSPDGKMIAQKSSNCITLWDTMSGQERQTVTTTNYGWGSLAFSRDGKTLATSGEGHVLQLWDVETGKLLTPTDGHLGPVKDIAFAPDSRTLASIGEDNTLRLWDLSSGKELRKSQLDRTAIRVFFAPDGKTLLTVDDEEDVRWWNAKTLQPLRRETIDTPYYSLPVCSSDGTILACLANNRQIQLRDGSTGELLRLLEKQESPLLSMTFGLGRRIVATTSHRGPAIQLWDVQTGKHWRTLEEAYDSGPVNPHEIGASPDGRLLTAHHRDTIKLWDFVSNTVRQTIPMAYKNLAAFTFAADSRMLVFGEYHGALHFWDLAEGREVGQLEVGNLGWTSGPVDTVHNTIRPIVFSPDGKHFATIQENTTITIWPVPHFARSKPVATQRANELWADLTAADASKAFHALRALKSDPAVVTFLSERLRPIANVDGKVLAQLIAELDHNQFATREKASHVLLRYAELALPALREALKAKPSAEARQRIETLLATIEASRLDVSTETLRSIRAIEILEHHNIPDARKHLEILAKGTPEARLTQEAKEALQRLARHAGNN
jgi:WD40 repeat protein